MTHASRRSVARRHRVAPWSCPCCRRLRRRRAATFAQRTVVTIDHTRVPDADGVPLTNFPVLVSVPGQRAQDDGERRLRHERLGLRHPLPGRGRADVRPAASPCRLDHEIESYDGATGTIVAWVRVPGIFDANDGAANTPIYMYYGDASITCSQENKAGVWDASYREVLPPPRVGRPHRLDVRTPSPRAAGARSRTGWRARSGRRWTSRAARAGPTVASLNVSDGTLPTGDELHVRGLGQLPHYTAGQYIGIVTKGRECLNFDGDPDAGRRLLHRRPPAGTGSASTSCRTAANNRCSPSSGRYGGACKPPGLQDPRRRPPRTSRRAPGTTWPGVFTTGGRGGCYVNGAQVATDAPPGACLEAAMPQYTRLGTDSNGELPRRAARRGADLVRRPLQRLDHDGLQQPERPVRGRGGSTPRSPTSRPAPGLVAATACPALNPCAGGPGTCYLRSIGNTAAYSTGSGTCTATNGSSVVTCPGAGWQTANRGRGDRITIDGTNYLVLAVDSETQLRLRTPFTGTTGVGNKSYAMSRQFATPQAWEDCISGAGVCPTSRSASGNLVAGNRSEIGVVYKDASPYTRGRDLHLEINGSTTDATHTITLTADGANRHYGVSGAGVVLDNAANTSTAVRDDRDQFVTVEWLEVRNGGGAGAHCIDYVPSNAANQAVIRNNIVRNCRGPGHPAHRVRRPATGRHQQQHRLPRGAGGDRIDSPLGTGTGSRGADLQQHVPPEQRRTAQPYTRSAAPRRRTPTSSCGTTSSWTMSAQAPDLDVERRGPVHERDQLRLVERREREQHHGRRGAARPASGQPDLGPNPRGGGLAAATEASLNFVNTTRAPRTCTSSRAARPGTRGRT